MRLLSNLLIKKRIKVAVSYASEDQVKTSRLGKAFKKAGIDYYDYQKDPDITSAEDLKVALHEVYNQCDFVVVFFSQVYFTPERPALATEFEVITTRLAQHDHDFLIPVRIDEMDFQSKHVLLEPFQYTPWSESNPGESLKRIVNSVLTKAKKYKIGKPVWQQALEVSIRISILLGMFIGLVFALNSVMPPVRDKIITNDSTSNNSSDTSNYSSGDGLNGGGDTGEDYTFHNLCAKDWKDLRQVYDSLKSYEQAKAFVRDLNRCLTQDSYVNDAMVFFAITSRPGAKAIKTCKADHPDDPTALKFCLQEQAELGIDFSRAQNTYDFSGVSSEVVRKLEQIDGEFRRSGTLESSYNMPAAEPYGKYQDPFYSADGVPVYVILFRKDKQ